MKWNITCSCGNEDLKRISTETGNPTTTRTICTECSNIVIVTIQEVDKQPERKNDV